MKERINYLREADKYRPEHIKTLLIGESPPQPGKKYFYVPSKPNEKRLHATIFHHYFRKMPRDKKEYEHFLRHLQKKGIFLIDIINKPLAVRGNRRNKQRVKKAIRSLKEKMKSRKISVGNKHMIFLLPRRSLDDYAREIKKYFPESKQSSWKEFRLN